MSSKFRLILSYIILIFIISSCNNQQIEFKSKINSDFVYFDSVEKKISIDSSFPDKFSKKLLFLFDNNIKTNGFDGSTLFNFDKFEKLEQIYEKKRKITMLVDLTITLVNNNGSNKKTFNYKFEEFGTIEGDFSINEYGDLVDSTENNLINNLIKNLNFN